MTWGLEVLRPSSCRLQPQESWGCNSLSPISRELGAPTAEGQRGRPSSAGRESSFLPLSLVLRPSVDRGCPALGRATCFLQSTNSNVNPRRKPLTDNSRNSILPALRASQSN